MEKYYVMSKKYGKNILTSIIGNNAFLVEDLSQCNNYADQIFYTSYFKLDKIKKMYLVTTFFKKYNFAIRRFVNEIYIVSKEFYEILEEFDVVLKNTINLVVVDHKNHSKQNENFILIEFNSVSSKEVIDLNHSNIFQEYEDTIDSIEKIKLKSDLNYDVFLISEMRNQFKSPICSEKFRNNFIEKGLEGVQFFDLDNAPWQNLDTLEFYFEKQTTGDVGVFVDPV